MCGSNAEGAGRWLTFTIRRNPTSKEGLRWQRLAARLQAQGQKKHSQDKRHRRSGHGHPNASIAVHPCPDQEVDTCAYESAKGCHEGERRGSYGGRILFRQAAQNPRTCVLVSGTLTASACPTSSAMIVPSVTSIRTTRRSLRAGHFSAPCPWYS